MTEMNMPTNKPLKTDLALSILQLIFALLFCAIYVVFLTSFGGEFLIVVKGLWILPIFVVLLLGAAVYATVMSALSKKSGELRGVLSDRIRNPTSRRAWLVGWAVWNFRRSCSHAILCINEEDMNHKTCKARSKASGEDELVVACNIWQGSIAIHL